MVRSQTTFSRTECQGNEFRNEEDIKIILLVFGRSRKRIQCIELLEQETRKDCTKSLLEGRGYGLIQNSLEPSLNSSSAFVPHVQMCGKKARDKEPNRQETWPWKICHRQVSAQNDDFRWPKNSWRSWQLAGWDGFHGDELRRDPIFFGMNIQEQGHQSSPAC